MQNDWEEKNDFQDRKLCEIKFKNLVKRREIYGDITQNATEHQLKRLLLKHDNSVPDVIADLDLWVRTKGSSTAIPPGFYDRDGQFRQPASFEMPLLPKK